MSEIIPVILFSCFILLVCLGVPIAISAGGAAILSILSFLPATITFELTAQKLFSGLDSFSLLAIPFFILTGALMNHGGIAKRIINLAQVLVGRMPGSLMHVNIMANMLFGALSGSAVAAAAAVGSVMMPEQKKAGYEAPFCVAVNSASCTSGLLIPPSNVMIVYSLSSGGVSVAGLFLAGYLPGILMGLGLMLATAVISIGKGYLKAPRPSRAFALKTFVEAAPCLLMIFIVIGGVIGGIFTATEASAIAVVYTFILSVFIYRQLSIASLPKIFIQTAVTTSMVMFLIACSVIMSWALNSANLSEMTTDLLMHVSSSPLLLLLLINVFLLVAGTFMDITPAILIFTPIFLPLVEKLGISPLHFGIIMIFNLCIGLVTPPVGSALFVGCSVGGVRIHNVIRPIIPLYIVLFIVLLLITYIPGISLWLPRLFGYA